MMWRSRQSYCMILSLALEAENIFFETVLWLKRRNGKREMHNKTSVITAKRKTAETDGKTILQHSMLHYIIICVYTLCVYIYIYTYIHTYIHTYILYHIISYHLILDHAKAPIGRPSSQLRVEEGRGLGPLAPVLIVRNFTRLAETRLAQNTLNYIKTAYITIT